MLNTHPARSNVLLRHQPADITGGGACTRNSYRYCSCEAGTYDTMHLLASHCDTTVHHRVYSTAVLPQVLKCAESRDQSLAPRLAYGQIVKLVKRQDRTAP